MTERDGDKCFNPRPRVGGDDCVQREEAVYHVSIHAPAWGATGGYNLYGCCTRVSIHAPAWGATLSKGAGTVGASGGFNPRPRVGGDYLTQTHAAGGKEFQSTPPRGGRRPPPRGWQDYDWKVSIHAPAWGATDDVVTGAFPKGVSIHAPAWGATRHPPEERGALEVSIHAPAWGATMKSSSVSSLNSSFNPRPRVGGDRGALGGRAAFRQFQSTPPRGGRPVIYR